MTNDYPSIHDMEIDVRDFAFEKSSAVLPPTILRADVELLFVTMNNIKQLEAIIARCEVENDKHHYNLFSTWLTKHNTLFLGMLNALYEHSDQVAQLRHALNEQNASNNFYDVDSLAG